MTIGVCREVGGRRPRARRRPLCRHVARRPRRARAGTASGDGQRRRRARGHCRARRRRARVARRTRVRRPCRRADRPRCSGPERGRGGGARRARCASAAPWCGDHSLDRGSGSVPRSSRRRSIGPRRSVSCTSTSPGATWPCAGWTAGGARSSRWSAASCPSRARQHRCAAPLAAALRSRQAPIPAVHRGGTAAHAATHPGGTTRFIARATCLRRARRRIRTRTCPFAHRRCIGAATRGDGDAATRGQLPAASSTRCTSGATPSPVKRAELNSSS